MSLNQGGFYVNNWTATPPTATNCGDESLKYYYAVRITASDSDRPLYQIMMGHHRIVYCTTSIKPKSLQSDDIVVTLTPQTFRYDGTVKTCDRNNRYCHKDGSKKVRYKLWLCCRRAADNLKKLEHIKYIYTHLMQIIRAIPICLFYHRKTKTDAGGSYQ